MKTLIRIEEGAMLFAAMSVAHEIGYDTWVFLCLLLAPDLSMLGYLINSKVGAWSYNLFHHRAVGLLTVLIGYLTGLPVVMFAGLILFGHSAMDRMFGYGLKFEDSFHNTHLGFIGRKANQP